MKLISFDVWGTLLDLNPMMKSFIESLSTLIGRDVENEVLETRDYIKKLRRKLELDSMRDLEISWGLLAERLEIEVELIKRAAARAILNVDEGIVFEDAREVLEKIDEIGIRIIVLGNVMFWPSSYNRLLLERFNLAKYIERQFYSDELKAYKPMRESFLKPLRELGISPSMAIHMGDTMEEDLEGAIKAGLKAALIDRGSKKMSKISENAYLIGELKDLLKLIRGVLSL